MHVESHSQPTPFAPSGSSLLCLAPCAGFELAPPPAASAMDNMMDVDKALEATFEGAPPHPDGPAGVEPAGNEGASLTFEGLLKRAKKKFIGHLDGPVASGEWSCCRRSRCSRARRRRRRRLSPPLLCRCHQTSCQPREDRHRQSLYHPPNPRLCRRCHRSLTPASQHACELACPRARPRKPACALCLRRCCGLHGEARARGRAGAERHQTGWVAADPSHSPPGPITCEWRRHAAALHSRTALPTAARDGAVSTVREYM